MEAKIHCINRIGNGSTHTRTHTHSHSDTHSGLVTHLSSADHHLWGDGYPLDGASPSAGTVWRTNSDHYSDVIMSTMASQITGVSIVYSTVCSGTDQRKYQSSASPAFVRGIHRWPGNSPHKGPVTRKMFPFGDVIMTSCADELLWDFLHPVHFES